MTSIEFELRTFGYVLVEAALLKTITVATEIDEFCDRICRNDFLAVWVEESWSHGEWMLFVYRAMTASTSGRIKF